MKLQTRYSRAYLLISIPAFIVISILYYFITIRIITDQADESIREDKDYIILQLEKNKQPMDLYLNLSNDYYLRQLENNKLVKDQTSTIMLYDKDEQENEPFRQLVTSIEVGDKRYELIIRKSMVEYNSIFYSIILIGFIFLGLITSSFLFINRFLTRRLWNPFFSTIRKLENYDLIFKSSLLLKSSNTDEFELLNNTVMSLTRKIQEDFINHKAFIDNVAHEVQTPLSIIKSNLDLLVQNKDLNQSDFKAIQNINETSDRLSRIVKSLLLLSKIDNNQFQPVEKLDLMDLVEKYINNHLPEVEEKDLQINISKERNFPININHALAEILVGNLLQNAIRHNVSKGIINIKCESNLLENGVLLEVANSGLPLKSPQKMFERFAKKSDDPQSTGLGLALVQRICDVYDIKVNYKVVQNNHIISLIYLPEE